MNGKEFRPDFPATVVSLGGRPYDPMAEFRKKLDTVTDRCVAQAPADIFTVTIKDVTERCPIAGETKIVIPREMYDEWVRLAGHYRVEWLAYCLGTQEGSVATITDFYFPPQKASGAHCENIEDLTKVRPGTIGAVHSHVNMGVFWSHEDSSHCNWPVELVVNARGDIKGLLRFELQCGKMCRLDAKVVAKGKRLAPLRANDLDEAFKAGAEWEERRKNQTPQQQSLIVAGPSGPAIEDQLIRKVYEEQTGVVPNESETDPRLFD